MQTLYRTKSKLDIIIQQSHLLTRLESRQANVRTSITPESIAQSAVATRAHLPLNSEIDFSEVVGAELREVSIGICAFGFVFGLKLLCEAAGAVFAGAPPLGTGFACFGCTRFVSVIIRFDEMNGDATYEY